MSRFKPAMFGMVSESRAVTGLVRYVRYITYTPINIDYPPALIGNTGPQFSLRKETLPTCPEEAESLKSAPPWAGIWATKPTLRQRIMLWVKYLRGQQ